MYEVSYGVGLEMVQHHFHHIPVVKASQISPGSRNKKIDSTFRWEEQQNQIAKSMNTQKSREQGLFL